VWDGRVSTAVGEIVGEKDGGETVNEGKFKTEGVNEKGGQS